MKLRVRTTETQVYPFPVAPRLSFIPRGPGPLFSFQYLY